MKLLKDATFNEVMAVVGLVSDVSIAILPLPIIKNLYIDRSESLPGTFALEFM